MMKILFTKKLNEARVSEKLGKNFSCQFEEVIHIKPLQIAPFDLKNYSLIFTSVNSVEAFFSNKFFPKENFIEKDFNKIYAVGLKTKLALRRKGFGTYKLAKNAKELLDFIVDKSSREKFLHFCGDLALDVLNQALPLQNISYKKVVIYETELIYPKISGNYNAVCFFSPSGVRSFAKFNSLDNMTLFSIGETTTKELSNFTNNRIITSKESNLDDLLKLISAQEK